MNESRIDFIFKTKNHFLHVMNFLFNMRIIIFDFYRTLYNPETNCLYQGTEQVLEKLRERGYDLYLLTWAEEYRKNLISTLGIESYFSRVIFIHESKEEGFQEILKNPDIEREASFVIGDRVTQEIFYGNKFGFQTVWIQHGEYTYEFSQNKEEMPKYIIVSLENFLDIAV